MPGITAAYLRERDITRIRNLYAGIIESYKEDVEKYASNEANRRVIRHIMETAPYEREVREAMDSFFRFWTGKLSTWSSSGITLIK